MLITAVLGAILTALIRFAHAGEPGWDAAAHFFTGFSIAMFIAFVVTTWKARI